MEKLETRVIYLRHTDVNGLSRVEQHTVWDFDRFILRCIEDAAKANSDQPKGMPQKATVSPATREEYLEQIKH